MTEENGVEVQAWDMTAGSSQNSDGKREEESGDGNILRLESLGMCVGDRALTVYYEQRREMTSVKTDENLSFPPRV
jgi:hypothetical protein